MTHTNHTFSVVLFFVFLLFTQCPKPISALTPAPSPTPTANDEDSSPTPTPTSSSGPTSDSPISNSERFELSLSEIGVQKATVASQTKEANLANKQLEGIEHKIEEFKTILTKREEGSASESTKSCLAQCQENLEEAIDGVKMGIESINDQDLEKANVDISGISTDVETCNDCFIELDAKDKDINAFTEWVKGVTKECLSNLKKIKN
ncbi:hypothetical protein E3N88_09652 [Mikania micrantha]|uniref:Pectinesterase inhibitor domain-containing protein n=1 Tax=Mikania micrantha TaxID=192012 RepID=A0A5N6PLX2_9ASTR|nr:hypothetical protein E3N88_09652 [Mikania micrantha]